MTLKERFVKHRYHLLMTLFVLCTTIVVTYFYEKYRPATDYFQYYGDVTSKIEYHGNEPIESHAFGENLAIGEAPDIFFRNELNCRPLDANEDFVLISVAASLAPDYVYWNPIDVNRMSRGMLNGERYQVISKALEDTLRAEGTNGDYGLWKLNNEKPRRDSECYIEAFGSIKTPIFGFEKTVVSQGNRFKYYIK